MSTLSVNTIKDVQSFDFANTSFASAFGTANSGYVVANAAFTYGNSSYTVANAAFGKANTALQNTSGTFAGHLTVTGYLGIGVNATAQLHMVGVPGQQAIFSTASSNVNHYIAVATSTASTTSGLDVDNVAYRYTPGAYKIFTGGANERMRIDANGNVGIGTSTPSGKLDINPGNAQYPTCLSVQPSSHATSRRSSITLDNWTVAQDRGGGGTKDFGIYNAAQSAWVFQIDTSGRITKPSQPGARISHTAQSALSFTAGNTIVVPFNNIIEQTGSNFNTSTYRYTAPVSGRYMITASAQGNSMAASSLLLLMIRVNGSGRFGTYQNGNGSTYQPLYTSGSTYVNAGDYFDVSIYSSQTSGNLELGSPDTRNMFSIYLLG